MFIPGRPLLFALSIIITALGVMMGIYPQLHGMAWVVAGGGLVNIAALLAVSRSRQHSGPREVDDINDLTPQRRRELVRGTSLYLRELNYRYSIRLDPNQSTEQRCFSAEVNTVKLGFVPVVIIDNTNDRQGYGYVAFVHDGKRWRGPGLPCPAGQVEAVRHAAKCVSPLAKEEETRF